MRKLFTCAIVTIVLAAPGMILPAAPASKTTSLVSPGSSNDVALRTARLLAGYGEPHLALATLRGRDFEDPKTARFAASLMTELGRPASAESLLAAEPTESSAGERFRDQLVRARLLQEAGRYDASLAAVASIEADSVSSYVAYRDLIAARALIGKRELERAAKMLERARARASDALLAEIDAARIDVYRALKRTDAALAAAVDAGKNAGDPAVRRELLQIRFDLALETGKREVAAEAARELFDDAHRSKEAEASAASLASRRDLEKFDTDLLLACATVLQTSGQRAPMRTVLRHLDHVELSAAQREEQRLLWGEYHYISRDYSRAIALARPAYSAPEHRRRSMLLMARSYRRVGRTADAAAVYEGYAAAFPNDLMSAETLYTAAALYEALRRDADRTRVLDQLRHAYPSTFHGWAASMERARELDESGADADAAAIFEQWLKRTRRTDEAALFYASRLKKTAGDQHGSDVLIAELRTVNPYSFYVRPNLLEASARPGARSAPATELRTWLTDAAKRRDEAFRRVEERVEARDRRARSAEVAGAIARGRFFLAVGFRDWAERELDMARMRAGNSPAEVLALARIFDENAMPWHSVRLYEKAGASIPWQERREAGDDFRYLTHPVPFPVQVMTAAQREAIAPHVLYGIMREESGFDTDVVSRAGAVGLMQLMPQTAREVARRLDMKLAPDGGLGDPVVNVSLGSWYAADLLRDGDGSVVWMLAAYNAGPGAVGQWMRPGVAGEAAIDAVESIDYKETRRYVKRVVESANVYHALYFDGVSGTEVPR